MAVTTIVETSAADQQKVTYNSSSGMVWRDTFSPAADTHAAVAGVQLADAVVDTDFPTLISNIEALSEVTSVVGNQPFGQCPSSVLTADHETIVHIDITMGWTDTLDNTSTQVREHRSFKPGDNKKWAVFNLVVPAALDSAGVAALKTALEGITGITAAAIGPVIDIPSTASSPSATVVGRMRIDPIPE